MFEKGKLYRVVPSRHHEQIGLYSLKQFTGILCWLHVGDIVMMINPREGHFPVVLFGELLGEVQSEHLESIK